MSQSFTQIRPWGEFRQFTDGGEPVTVKIITIKAGEETSLQYHQKRSEFWVVLSGTPQIMIGEETKSAQKGDEFIVPVSVKHRLSAQSEDVEILEISSGEFSEDDIFRIKDKYGRS